MKKFVIAAAGLALTAGGFSALGAGPAEAQQRGAPRGSYAQSCEGSYVNQGRLYADCRDMRGNMRSTSIELARCSSSDVSNNDGLLVCQGHRGDFENSRPGGGRPGGGRPGGGWGGNNGSGHGSGHGSGQGGWSQSSITVYRDSNYRGQSMTFREEISNLRNTGMNDAISSIRLSGGAWEVCEDANFRGRCEVIRNDTRDLNRMGMNDKISSMRPVRSGGGRW